MKFQSKQFGELECDDNYRITFPSGVIGFEEFKDFIIVNDESTEPFRWLVSTQDEAVCFPMIDPREIVKEYKANFPRSNGDLYEIYSIVCLKPSLEETTINLRSPIVINAQKREGVQIILNDEEYSVSERFA